MKKVWSGARCPCWDGSPEAYDKKCLHPEAVVWRKNKPMFKDEPQDHTKHPSCIHKKFRGPTVYYLSSMSKEEYNQFIANNTCCTHPEEYTEESDGYTDRPSCVQL